MKLILKHRWLKPDHSLEALIRQKIAKLKTSIRIEAAEVTLERRPVGSPPFATKVHLVVPGPDLHAEEIDHTPQAAIHKALAKLARQIRQRKEKLLPQRRTTVTESGRSLRRLSPNTGFQPA